MSSRNDALVQLESLLVPHGPWVEQAACRGVGARLFHPERGEPTKKQKATCQGCPVRDECLDFALRNNIRCGIWGGLSEKERRPYRRERGLLARPYQIAPHERRALEAAAMKEAS